MTGSVAGIRRRRMVAGRRETPHLPPDRDFYGQTLCRSVRSGLGSGCNSIFSIYEEISKGSKDGQ